MTKFRNYDMPGQLPVLSWNPIVMRCPGCELSKPDAKGWVPCWHLRMCNRMMHNPTIPVTHREVYAGNAVMRINHERSSEPLTLRKPRVIATQFMGDLGQADDECQQDVFMTIAALPEHTFIVLTKWPEKIKEDVPDNCYLGTTGTNQTTATERLKNLAHCKAKNIWFSAEPMLGDMRIGAFIRELRFVACGPETGARARAFIGEGDAISDLEGQCKAAGVPFYDKRAPIHCGILDFEPVREWPEEWKK